MAKIFSSPIEYKQDFSIKGLANLQKADEDYEDSVRQWLSENGYTSKHAGKVVSFPYADGYANYMVVSMRPLQLIHLPLGDAWNLPYIERLTAKDIRAKLNADAAWADLVAANRK